MPNAAVICELNPLHNGHAGIFAAARSLCGESGYIIAIMSGNFVQRGDVAVIDKWARAKAAVLAGADVVVEIPSKFAVSSAQFFAEAGVSIANSLGFVDYLVFGSETGDIGKLTEFSEFSAESVTKNMAGGKSYASAVAEALGEAPSSNDILAAEYVKALRKTKSKIIPYPVKRLGDSAEASLVISGKYTSATAIRNTLPDFDAVKDALPDYSLEIIKEKLEFYGVMPDISLFDQYITAKLRELGPSGISGLPFAGEGLENKIFSEANSGKNVTGIISACTSRRYTAGRIRRILVSTLTGAKKTDFENGVKVPYVRLLAIKREKREILAALSQNSTPFFAGNFPADYENIFRKDKPGAENEIIKNTIKSELLATDLYFLAMKNEDARRGGRELSTPLIVM